MFSTNDTIQYGGSGVCTVQEIAVMRFGRTRERYYVLKPLHQHTSVIYVPLNNEQLVAKMRPILTRAEVEALIDGIDAVEPIWIEDINERKLRFEELLRSGDCVELIRLIKSLQAQRLRRQADGKALHVSDENCIREAQRLLYDEFAGALELEPKQVEQMLRPRFGLN